MKFFQKSCENLLKNWATALPTILVIALVLTMFHGLLSVNSQAKTALQNIQQKFSITIYLKDDADPFEVGNLITALEERPDIRKPVIYTSKEEAWKIMSKTFSLDNELLKKYKFSLPASLTITPTLPENTPAIESFLETTAKYLLKDSSLSKQKQKNITAQMVDFIKTVEDSTLQTLLFFIVFFVIGGALLISSTIHLAINTRHKEIAIMKLIGAAHSSIMLPFIIEGFLISIAAFVLNMLLVFLLMPEIGSLNALLFEFMAVVLLGAGASYLTALVHIKRR